MMEAEKAEVLRYLGRRGQDVPPELDALTTECMRDMREAAAPRLVQREFGIIAGKKGVFLENTTLTLAGRDIRRHLRSCSRALVFAATLGRGADSLIRRFESVDITRALVLDACATCLIEQFCDEAEQCVRIGAKNNGFAATSRFSPGYGDLPLDVQPMLLAVLDAERKIGLTCTESLILLPRKSVTAVIGLGEGSGERFCGGEKGCESCLLNNNCDYRR